MSASVEIRAVTSADATQIFEIIEHYRINSPVPIGPAWTLAQVEEECGHGGWVLTEVGRLVAFVLARDIGTALEIGFLATAYDACGRGFMVRLLERLKAELAAEQELWLEVHENNGPARQLYDRIGFEVVGRRPTYYSDGGGAVLYSYPPKP